LFSFLFFLTFCPDAAVISDSDNDKPKMQLFTIILGFIVNLMLHQQINASWVKECYSCEGNCTVNEQMTKIKCGKRGSTTGDEHFACYSMKLIKGR
jgi:hypothetical protein